METKLSKDGFTIIELMIVVAIIGVLSAIAIPNFQKYQAKSKTSEAKLHLAAVFTAQQSFFGDYNIFASCLAYMGYDPSNEEGQRYYAVGFEDNAAISNVDVNAATAAVSLGLVDTAVACQITAGVTPAPGEHYFLAGRGIGATIANSEPDLEHDGTASGALGDQSNTTNMTFLILAVGYISADNVTTATSSVYTVDENKTVRPVRQGF